MVKATTAIAVPSWCKVLHKGQSTDSLLKKLKDLQSILSRPEVKEIENASILATIRDQLVKEQLLFHNSKEVRSSLACCLADLLRLCAPESPYDDGQLQTIFQFFLTVLTKASGGLSKPNGPLFADACMLLDNLVATRCITLIYDLESGETLMSDYFSRFFAIVKPDLPRKVELASAKVLADLVKEIDAIPRKVIEILLGHFHPAVKKTNPAASHLATLVCKEASLELQSPVNQYISEAIIKATSKEETPEMEQALQKIHVLIVSINKSAPEVLVSVIPQLEDGLRAENDTLREASVRTLAQMFSEKASQEGGGGDLAQKYASTWKAWLCRYVDKSAAIRTTWAESVRNLLVHHAELWPELEGCVLHKLIDPDEKVRFAMIKTFGSLDYETLRHHISRKVLKAIGQRALDKKEAVRLEALKVIGSAFSLAYHEMSKEENGEATVKEQFGWIPGLILSTLKQGLPLAQVPVQNTLSKYILPLPSTGQEDETAWTERYLFVLQCLDDSYAEMLFKISNFKDPRQRYSDFLEACKKFNGGIIDGNQETITATKRALIRPIEQIASRFPDPALAAKELNEFAKQNDARAYKLMATIMDSRSDLKTYVAAVTAIKKKLLSSSGKSNATMTAVVQMAGYPYISTSSVPMLLNKIQTLQDSETDKILSGKVWKLLKAMADHDAALFANHTGLLLQTLQDSKAKNDVVAICLLALAKMQSNQSTKSEIQLNRTNIKKIRQLITKGTHQEAKYAAKLLAVMGTSEDVASSTSATNAVEEICEELAHDLTEYDAARLAASMAALKQFAKHANDAMMHLDNSLVSKVLQGALTKPWSTENSIKEGEADEEAEDWVEDEDMNDELRARVTALKFLTQRCLSNAEDGEVVHMMIKPVLKLLFACLTHGQPTVSLRGNAAARARMRCVSAVSLLKLARHGSCEKNITMQEFQTFATTVQDETFQVREHFLHKLLAYWLKRSANLPSRYYVLGFMTAFDPEEVNRNTVQATCITLHNLMTKELRLKYFDIGLARLLHLLNHYPDFADGGLNDLDSLKNVAVYLDFYLDCCANESNLACLYYIANRCKGHQDISGPEASQGLYRLSELAMCLIKRRADAMGCNVGNWAGRVNLPVELFKPLPSRADQNEIYKRSYLSDEEADFFQHQAVKRPANHATKRKASTVHAKEIGDSNKKKRAKTAKVDSSHKKKTSKGRRKSAKAQEESEEESELSDAIMEDGDEDVASEAASDIQEDDEEVSQDEEINDFTEEDAEGRGARVKERLRKEKLARNKDRARRRQEKGAVAVFT